MAAAQSLTNVMLTADPQPVAIDDEIEAAFNAVRPEVERRYGARHGESVASAVFSSQIFAEEAYAALTKDGLVYYLKLVLGSARPLGAPDVHSPGSIIGVRIVVPHSGAPYADTISSLQPTPLGGQLQLLLPAPARPADAPPSLELPKPVAVDETIERLCQLARPTAERRSAALAEGKRFAEFTPVEAMRMEQPRGGGRVYYVKVRTAGQDVAGSLHPRATDHVALKLLESREGRFVDVVGDVRAIGETMPLARLRAQLDGAPPRAPSAAPAAAAAEPPPPKAYPGGGIGGEMAKLPSHAVVSSAEEVEYSGWMREGVAPLLSEAVLCALRDQPADCALYLADFIARRQGKGEELLAKRKMLQDYARLEQEIADTEQDLEAAQKDVLQRLLKLNYSSETMESHIASAKWNEISRLKRLSRNIKFSLEIPLQNSDWALPHGVLLVQGRPGGRAAELCRQMAETFGAEFVVAGGTEGRRPVTEGWAYRPDRPDTCFVVEAMNATDCLEVLKHYLEKVGRPLALMLLHGNEATNVGSSVLERRRQGASWRHTDDWLEIELPALEASARALHIPATRVSCEGSLDEQMKAMLIAATSR
ncbi:hypothetical protein AB1Y20_013246 [Prymnesium parvum]|uniref:Uncharacterized protein n=1 Tax=Prymnesium parvum TaxID=97485 RepID=A0AB34INM9_PRYPA